MSIKHNCVHCNNNFCDFFMEAFADSEDGIIWQDCDDCEAYIGEAPETDDVNPNSISL